MTRQAELLAAPDLIETGLCKRITKNTVWLLIGRIGSQGMALLFSVLVARRLGEVGLGQYAFIASVVFVGNLATTFGTDMLIIREVAGRRDRSVLSGALITQLVLSIPFILIVFLVAPIFPNQTPEVILGLQIYSLAFIPMAFYSVFSAYLRGLERMDAYTWLNLLNGISLVILALLFIGSTSTIVQLAWILLVVQLLSACAALWLCWPQLPSFSAWKSDRAQLVALVTAAAPIAILGIVGALYQRAGVFLLSANQGAAATGGFSATLRVVEAAKLGHFALLGALFPAMSQSHPVAKAAYQNVFSRSLTLLLALALAIAIVLFFSSGWLIPLLFGTEFSNSISQLQNLAWILVPMALTHFFSLRLLAIKQEKPIMISLIAAILVLIIFTASTIARWSVLAVVWGLLLSESIQAGILLFYWRKQNSS